MHQQGEKDSSERSAREAVASQVVEDVVGHVVGVKRCPHAGILVATLDDHRFDSQEEALPLHAPHLCMQARIAPQHEHRSEHAPDKLANKNRSAPLLTGHPIHYKTLDKASRSEPLLSGHISNYE